MSQNPKAVDAVRGAEALLCSAPQGELDLAEVEERVRAALRSLGGEEPRWIDLARATRLLGVMSDATPHVMVQHGFLRSRSRGDGQLEVRLDDVLHERWDREALLAIGGEELTPEELDEMEELRPGTNPWEREPTGPSS